MRVCGIVEDFVVSDQLLLYVKSTILMNRFDAPD
jgi:hypothetical protein